MIPLANHLFALMELPPLPEPKYVERYPRGVDLNALTAQEREWLEASELEERA